MPYKMGIKTGYDSEDPGTAASDNLGLLQGPKGQTPYSCALPVGDSGGSFHFLRWLWELYMLTRWLAAPLLSGQLN